MIGDVIAEELFEGQAPIGETLRIGNVPFTIIGVLDKKGQGAMGRNQDDVVFIPLVDRQEPRSRAQCAATRARRWISSSSRSADAAALPEAQKDIKALLRQRHQLRKDAA